MVAMNQATLTTKGSTRARMVWCSKRVAAYAGLLLGPSMAAVFWLSHKPAYIEAEYALGALSVFLFFFFSIGLYLGARLKRPNEGEFDFRSEYARRKHERKAQRVDKKSNSWWDSFDCSGLGDLLVVDEGILGFLLGIVLALVVLGLLAALAYVFAQFGIDPFAVLGGGIGWILYRGFRRVFLGRRGCAGNLPASLANAAGFTLLYTGWGFLLIEILKRTL